MPYFQWLTGQLYRLGFWWQCRAATAPAASGGRRSVAGGTIRDYPRVHLITVLDRAVGGAGTGDRKVAWTRRLESRLESAT